MKVKRKVASLSLGVAMVVVTLLGTGVGAAHADTAYDPVFTHLGGSDRCLDVRKQDDYYHANARVQIWDCSGALEQQWSSRVYGVEPPSGEFGVRKKLYQIVNLRSGMCLEVRDAGTSVGREIDQFPCITPGGSIDVSTNQLWQVDSLGISGAIPKYSLLPWSAVRVNVSMCLDVRHGESGNGTMLQQYPCNSTSAQSFAGSLAPS
jgi:hypothetical protein